MKSEINAEVNTLYYFHIPSKKPSKHLYVQNAFFLFLKKEKVKKYASMKLQRRYKNNINIDNNGVSLFHSTMNTNIERETRREPDMHISAGDLLAFYEQENIDHRVQYIIEKVINEEIIEKLYSYSGILSYRLGNSTEVITLHMHPLLKDFENV